MARFTENGSLLSFQKIINEIYGLPDDRLFSLPDLVSNQERFTMRALKGIRKNDKNKLKLNLLVAFSWTMAIANRLHINIENIVWQRFPYACSYCGQKPCVCKKDKVIKRVKSKKSIKTKPATLFAFQQMLAEIYPAKARTLSEAGVHLAEETGELTEAIYDFLGQHKNNQFDSVKDEMADYVSCFLGVVNSSGINVAKELSKMYKNNCHACHKCPCACNFSFVSKFKS